MTTSLDPTQRRLALAAFAFSALVWGSAFAGIRAGLAAYTPVQIALLRFSVASLVLGLIALVRGLPMPRLKDLPGLALIGLLGITLYNVAIGQAQRSLTSGTTSFLVASAPIWMALLGSLVFKERLGLKGWAGILLSFLGVTLIALGSKSGLRFQPAALLALAAALCQSLLFLGQKPFLKRYSPLQVTTYAIWAGTLFLLPFGGGLLAAMARAPLATSDAVVYLGIFPGALGYLTWSYGLARLPAATAGSFLYLVPPIALGLGWLAFREVPAGLALQGGALVLIGVALVNTRLKAAKEKASVIPAEGLADPA
jgi:drug/metabolite transporter (DMT)-like permease